MTRAAKKLRRYVDRTMQPAQENPTRAANFDRRLKVGGAQFEYLVCCNAKIYVKSEAKWRDRGEKPMDPSCASLFVQLAFRHLISTYAKCV